MTTTQAHAHGYGAYWDGYYAYCMDSRLTGEELAEWRKGFAEARRESKAMMERECLRLRELHGIDDSGNTQSQTQ